MELKRYYRIFQQANSNRFAIYAASRSDFVFFLLGKFLRMGFFVVLALSIFLHTKTLAGYDKGQVLMFFAVMNLIDILAQAFWYRGMYNLKDWIRRGKFDHYLIQPVSPLFKMAAMQMDLFDVITLPVAIGYIYFAWTLLPTTPSAIQILMALGMFVCSLILAFSTNLCLAAMAFWTTENESAWGLYRDSIYVARFPAEIFPSGIRAFFFYVIPVLAIVALPAKALMGLLDPTVIIVAVVLTIVWFVIGLTVWRAGLKHYTSASG